MRVAFLALMSVCCGCMALTNDAVSGCEQQKANFSAYNARCGRHWVGGMPATCSDVIYLRCDVDACRAALEALACDGVSPPECDCHYVTSEEQ